MGIGCGLILRTNFLQTKAVCYLALSCLFDMSFVSLSQMMASNQRLHEIRTHEDKMRGKTGVSEGL